MKDAIKELSGRVRTNAFDKHYPTGYEGCPLTMTLERHIEIYQLIEEYKGITTDLNNSSNSTTKKLLENRLREIESELFGYWIVKDDEMEVGK